MRLVSPVRSDRVLYDRRHMGLRAGIAESENGLLGHVAH